MRIRRNVRMVRDLGHVSPCAYAFTMIEAVVAILVVSLMAVAALNMMGATARSRRVHDNTRKAQLLTEQLLAEIMQHAYAEPVDASTPGTPETDENTGDRTNFDDADDYMGWHKSPPEHPDGTVVANRTGWTRQAFVEWIDPAGLTVSDTETGLRRVRVLVTNTDGARMEMMALRSRAGPSELQPTQRTYASSVTIALQTHEDASTHLANSAALLNEPSPILPNLLVNGGFESGVPPWMQFDDATLTQSTFNPHSGGNKLTVSGRTNADAGPRQDISSSITNGQTYQMAAWVRRNLFQFDDARIMIYTNSSKGGEQWFTGSWVPTSMSWKKLTAVLTPTWSGTLTSAYFKVHTKTNAYNIYVDEMEMVEVVP